MERSIKLTIDHHCPQCGAPITLEETDRLITCPFCRVKSYLSETDCFRYVLPLPDCNRTDLLYFPYWRYKGMLFYFSPAGIGSRFVDVSQQAIDSVQFPLSLGLRSQALKLRFVTPELSGRFLKPTVSAQAFHARFDERFAAQWPQPILLKEHVGDRLSLIYAPYYVQDRVYDAVLNRPVPGSPLPDNFTLDGFAWEDAPAGLHFLATLCPNCGWDLQGERDSLVLHCVNCASAFRVHQHQLSRLKVAHLPASAEPSRFMPFWRIKAAVTGIELATYADLIRVANLAKVVLDKWLTTEFHFWCPAFKVRPQNYLTIASSLTLAQPLQPLAPRIPTGSLHPVNLALQEALDTLKLNLVNFMRPRQAAVDGIHELEIAAVSALLVYLPFEERPHEFVLPWMNLAIHKNHLALADNL